MHIAFYAPLKPPTHPVPSGDRRMARQLMEALRQSGHEVELASRFRSYDGHGDAQRQARLKHIGEGLAARLLRRYAARDAAQRPALWFTYHLYHKAPDFLGPAVARGLNIPYVAAEASYAGKQEGGPWTAGHREAGAAIKAAAMVVNFNAVDAAGVRKLHGDERRMIALPPFIDAAPFQQARMRKIPARENTPLLLTVAMMRPGDKLDSYRLLGAALQTLLDRPWQLLVVGDGPARSVVETCLAPLGDRVRYAGELPPDAMPAIYAGADLYVWPAMGEAYGMAFLEAQAAGLPVVAGDNYGVSEVVDTKAGALVPAGDAAAFATALRRLLDTPDRALRSAAAQDFITQSRSMAVARRVLEIALTKAIANHRP